MERRFGLDLARRLSVSRTTVTVAFDRLAGEGYVKSRVGAGTYVGLRRETVPADAKKRRPAGVLRPRPVWDAVRVPVHRERLPRFCFITGMPDASLFPTRYGGD